MRLTLAQINTVVGDLDGNRDLILSRLQEARERGADLALFPELAVTGYPPEDLLLRPGFVRAAAQTLGEVAAQSRDIVALVGFPFFDTDLYNACAVCAGGEVKAVYRKRFLPNYGFFDEDRYFASAHDLLLLEHDGTLIGPTICEDMWQPGPPATDLALAGAQLLTNISASPFHVCRDREREEMFATRARDNACFVAFCNAVGGQDELIFDGHSCARDDPALVVDHARMPVEDQLVLSAHRVTERDEARVVARAGHEHLLTLELLADVERRCAHVDEQLRTGQRQIGRRRAGLPHVLADRHAD